MAATFAITGGAAMTTQPASIFALCRFHLRKSVWPRNGAWLRGFVDTKLKCLS